MGSGREFGVGLRRGGTPLVGEGLSGGDYATEEAIAVLKSRYFTEAFIRDNNLLPELFPKLWDSEWSLEERNKEGSNPWERIPRLRGHKES